MSGCGSGSGSDRGWGWQSTGAVLRLLRALGLAQLDHVLVHLVRGRGRVTVRGRVRVRVRVRVRPNPNPHPKPKPNPHPNAHPNPDPNPNLRRACCAVKSTPMVAGKRSERPTAAKPA